MILELVINWLICKYSKGFDDDEMDLIDQKLRLKSTPSIVIQHKLHYGGNNYNLVRN